MSLSREDMSLASQVFVRLSKRDFAYGYFDQVQPIRYTTASSTTASTSSYTHFVPMKTVKCKAEVPGLDHAAFLQAVAEFMELSRQQLFDTLATVEEPEEE